MLPPDSIFDVSELDTTPAATQATPPDMADCLRRIGLLYEALHQLDRAPLLRMSTTDVQAATLLAECGTLRPGRFAALAGLSHGGARLALNRLQTAGYIADPGQRKGQPRTLAIAPLRCDAVRRVPADVFLAWIDAHAEAPAPAIEAGRDALTELARELVDMARG